MTATTAPEPTDADRALAERINATYRAPLPTIEQFIDDPYYLGLGDQCCGLVRETLLALFDVRSQYLEAALIWGIGTGKSFLTSIADAYIVYRVLCLRDTQAYYGFARGSTLAVVNFSVTATQAHKVVFSEVRERVDNAPCFQQDGFKRDTKIGSELRWPDSNIVIFPGNSQATSAIGYNVLAAVVDEASFLPDVDTSVRVAGQAGQHRYDAAEELYNAIAKRILSRGNWRFKRDSLFCMISSPRYVDDFLERKAQEAAENLRIYHSRRPTWEGAQKNTLCGETFEDAVCGPVPVEYRAQFQRNPEKARRDLGAVPSEAIGGFFSDPSVIAAHCNYDREGPDYDGHGKPALAVHVDLGLKRDACGIAGAYAGGPGVVAAFYKRITPADHGGEIDFEEIRRFLLALRDVHGWRLSVSFDGWQSVDSRQQLRKAGIGVLELSVDRDTVAYDTLKGLMLTERLDYYEDQVLFEELRRLELVKGKKVDHPPNGSKDLADALAGAVYRVACSIGIGGTTGLLTPDQRDLRDPLKQEYVSDRERARQRDSRFAADRRQPRSEF
jgi:hypothetical protein